MNELLIRKMNTADIPVVAEVFVNAYSDVPWCENWSREDAIVRVTDYFHYPNSRCYVALYQNTIVGGILCDVLRWHKGKQIEIKELFVSPNMQKKGIGKALFYRMENDAIDEGIGEIIFWTDIHPKMQSFYTGMGCKISQGEVIMHKKIIN